MGPSNIIIISLTVFILLMLAIAGQLTYMVLKHDTVYKGVYVNNLDVSGLTREELTGILKKTFQEDIAGTELVLKAGDRFSKFSYVDIEVSMDIPDAVGEAYGIGRTGNIFQRLYQILLSGKQSVKLEMPLSFNRDKLEQIVNAFYNETLINVKEADVLVQEDRVVLRSGHSGRSIDKSKVLTDIESLISRCEGGEVNVPFVTTSPNKINVEELYAQINIPAQNASTKVENNTVNIIPHVIGKRIDKSKLDALAEELDNTENIERILPVELIKPEITAEDVKTALFRDILCAKNTQFSVSDENNKNRAENIKIAVSKINGKILAPGEVFSFNETVGPRTEDGGYQVAHTYVKGKIVDGIGGGICQVSSTLYNAVLFSDLEVVERRNHMFTVGYVPKGTDATVSYGDVDFKFRNSTAWPLKIEAWVTKNNKVYFSLIGTNEFPGKTVEISPKTIKTNEFKTVYVDDPTIPEGKTEVKQKGMTGYVIDTYKIVKQDGKVVSESKLHTSVYKALDQEVIRGTKKVPAAAAQPTKDVPHSTGVDDADNPPAEE